MSDVPYADIDATVVGRLESGDYYLLVTRTDDEQLCVSLRPAQLRALEQSARDAMDGDAE